MEPTGVSDSEALSDSEDFSLDELLCLPNLKKIHECCCPSLSERGALAIGAGAILIPLAAGVFFSGVFAAANPKYNMLPLGIALIVISVCMCAMPFLVWHCG